MADHISILLIEDIDDDAQFASMALRRNSDVDFRIQTTPMLKDAVAVLRRESFDVILTDLNLPDSDGVETVRTLSNAAPGTAIVVLSQEPSESIARDVTRAGALDFILKTELGSPTVERRIRLAIERNAVQQSARRGVTHDFLTDIPNRAHLLELLQRELDRALNKGHAVALALIDIDAFASINSQFGRDTGDQVLASTAIWLKQCAGECDLVGRLGADEFAVAFTQVNDPAELFAVCERLMEFRCPVPGVPRVSISAGIAVLPDDAVDIGHLLSCADEALADARRAGGGRFNIYSMPATDEHSPVLPSTSLN